MKKKTVSFETVILKFGKQGEKTGWRYIEVAAVSAQQLFPGNRKAFRVSGKIDNHSIDKIALMPMGDGRFILPLKQEIRKAIGKKEGMKIMVSFYHDTGEIQLDPDLIECLNDDAIAKNKFYAMTPSHRSYFSKWIGSAKTPATKAKRIAMTLEAMVKNMDFGAMLRAAKKNL
jgi:hypothetical protein